MWLELPFARETQGFVNGTCGLERKQRLLLGLAYWVGWNQIADAVATHASQIEVVTAHNITRSWCAYCADTGRCNCPVAADGVSVEDDGSVDGEPLEKARPVPRPKHGLPQAPSPMSSPLSWRALQALDAPLAAQAAALAAKYGYAASD